MNGDDVFSLDGPPDDDPTAAMLREVLHRQADAVRPSQDGLSRIRAEIARQPRRGRRLPGRRHLTPLVAAAAAAVVVAAGGTLAVQAVAHRRSSPVPVGAIAQHMVDQHEVEEAPAATLPVYVAARQNGRAVLFREFRRVAAGDVDGQVAQAVKLSITTKPVDADYTQLFAPVPEPTVTATVTTERIQLDISPAPRPRSTPTTPEEARVAVQQLLWTATASAAVAAKSAPPGSPAVAGVVPESGRQVRITLEGRSDAKLFGQVPLDRDLRRDLDPAADPRAKVWIIDPPGGSRPVGELDADGDAVAIGDPSVLVSLSRGGILVRQERVPLVASESSGGRRPPLPGQRGTWRIRGWDIGVPGTYELAVYAPAITPATSQSVPTMSPGPTASGVPPSVSPSPAGPGEHEARTDAAASAALGDFWWDTKTFTAR